MREAIQRVSWYTAKGVIRELMEEHYDEVVTLKGLMKLNPRWDAYDALEDDDKLISIIASSDGKPAGYSLNIIDQHLHYADLTVAQNDVLFVAQRYRNSSLGLKIMSRTKELARKAGAELMLWHAKPDTPLDQILKRRSRVQDIVYADEL